MSKIVQHAIRQVFVQQQNGIDYVFFYNPSDNEYEKVPLQYLLNVATPQSENEVIFVNNYASLPVAGIQERIYITKNNYHAYMYDGATYQRINRDEVVTVSTATYTWSYGDTLDINVPNAVINIPATPRGTQINIINGALALNTTINSTINGSTSYTGLYNPYDSITLLSLGTEYRIL